MKRLLVAIVGVAVLIVVVDFLAGPFFALSMRHWPPERHGDRMLGVIESVVKRVDRSAGVLQVASGVLGLGTLRVVVAPETTVIVGDKLGGLPDLERAYFVRVTYEAQAARMLAWRVDLIDREAHASDALVRHLIAEVGTVSTAAAVAAPDPAPSRKVVSTPKAETSPPATTRPRPSAPASRKRETAVAKPRPRDTAPVKAPAERPRSRAVTATRTPSPPGPASPPETPVARTAVPDNTVPAQLDLPFPVTTQSRAGNAAAALPLSVDIPSTPSRQPDPSRPSSLVPQRPEPALDGPRPTRSSQAP